MLQNYPLQIDLFAIIILLGIVQGFFLAFFFIFIPKGNIIAHRYLGLFLLAVSLCTLEVLLCYTNYMFKTLRWVDFAEPLNFVIAPFVFLYVKSYLSEKFSTTDLLHFIPFVYYLAGMIYYIYHLPVEYRYNSYLDAYHPELTFIKDSTREYGWFFSIREYVNDLMFWQMLLYVCLGFVLLQRAFHQEQLSLWSRQNQKLSWCRTQLLSFASIVLIYLIIKLTFPSDLGDHILSVHITLVIYTISFSVIRQSVFFTENPTKPLRKYEKSSLTNEIQDQTLERLNSLIEQEKPYLTDVFSLPWLAQRLSVSPHHLSQILNESLGQSFFDYTAQLRISEAKKLLRSPEKSHLKIEEIAEQVGYNSKSAFNTAFKKIVGQTPSQFRNSA